MFPCRTNKTSQISAKPLNLLDDLAHTIDKSFVLVYPSQVTSSDSKISVTIATKLPDLPANLSFDTQGALNELPLDVSNNMD
ncbi:hypothetical protein DSO57_1007950 [Entomophthora muscae]|uniref:Uncharacterized protein n=1 Tax=Entomophthora muscae TaxID=34485 RepID=A0ACC2SW40_9FUNG|nr:hypothetical protein DSO57_1007950 [Entomophthora muscae]